MPKTNQRGLRQLVLRVFSSCGRWITAGDVHSLIRFEIPPETAYREGSRILRLPSRKDQGHSTDFEHTCEMGGKCTCSKICKELFRSGRLIRRETKKQNDGSLLKWEYRINPTEMESDGAQ